MNFRLKVYRDPEGVSVIALDAVDESAAARTALDRGYSVLSIERRAGLPGAGAARKAFPLSIFSQELLALLRAGLNLVEAFETLAEKEPSAANRTVLDRVLGALYAGNPLSRALEDQREVFPALYIATIRASERTGDVARALERFVAYDRQLDAVRKRVTGALIYPAVLVAVGALVTLFLLAYVVPRFSRIFDERGTELPLLTRLLVDWGSFMNARGIETAAVAAVALALLAFAASQPAIRKAALVRLGRLPGFGATFHVFQLARLYRTLGMLLQGGMPLVASLGMVRGLLEPRLAGHLDAAARSISEGIAPSSALHDHGLTTPVAARLLRVGEQTGELGAMMERIAEFYDEDIARAADLFTRVFEPVLMVLIGAVIGSIVLLMYLPIFELASSID